jgi:hypothetical protein
MNRSMAAIGTAPFKTHNDDGGIHGQLHLTDVVDNRLFDLDRATRDLDLRRA